MAKPQQAPNLMTIVAWWIEEHGVSPHEANFVGELIEGDDLIVIEHGTDRV